MSDRAKQFLVWATETFGDVAQDPRERGMRFIEEAIELMQAAGFDRWAIDATVDRVYSRPASRDRGREFGQALVTLEMFAEVWRCPLDAEAEAELARVRSIPKEEWARRHAAKVAKGIAS